MNLVFAIIAAVTIAAAVAAMSLRNLVHCALALAVAFAGIAAVYLQLGAQFVGFTQLLVYVGAVAILVVFAILLTRGAHEPERSTLSSGWIGGIVVTVLVLGLLVFAISKSSLIKASPSAQPDVTVRQIGNALMNKFVLPMEVVGLLLTAALIGAVIIAMKEEGKK
jgi:NADH-quinone oxidoreductase subunit J